MSTDRTSFQKLTAALIFAAMAAALMLSVSARAYGADENSSLLTGTVKSDSGEKMPGVTVSAKGEAKTITTSVFTDQQGDYYFPPMPPGEYEVWAQADTFATARGNIKFTSTHNQGFLL